MHSQIDSGTDNASTIEKIDAFMAKHHRAIARLLRGAAAVIPGAFDAGLSHDKTQTHEDPEWPFDAWFDRGPHSSSFNVKAGHWHAVVDFRNEGLKVAPVAFNESTQEAARAEVM